MYKDSDYNNAIKIWLIRNSYDLDREIKRRHQFYRNKGMINDIDFIDLIEDVHFSSSLEGDFSTYTPGWEEPNITFKFNNSYFIEPIPSFDASINASGVIKLIRECVEIMDEIK